MKKILFLIALAMPFASQAADWAAIKTLKCHFTSAANFDGKKVEISKEPFGKMELILDSIDLNKGTLRAIGNAGADDAVILTHEPMLSTITTTATGNPIFTTISESEGELLIVSSRHMMMGSIPVMSQNYGTCKVFN